MALKQSSIVIEPGTGKLELWDIEVNEENLKSLLVDLFENHWKEIIFGPLIQGAAWEITANHPPEKIVLFDGYLTVDFGDLHFHICIGENRGDPYAPTKKQLGKFRRTQAAHFFRRINRDDAPDTWGIRLFNGQGEQQITILLPNPFLSGGLKFLDKPDWGKLKLWDYLRQEYLGLSPDPLDRSGSRMIYP